MSGGQTTTANLFYSLWVYLHADLQSKGASAQVPVAEWIGLCSAMIDRPVIASTGVMGELTLSGTMTELTHLESAVRVAVNAGAKKLLLPMDTLRDFTHIPSIRVTINGDFTIAVPKWMVPPTRTIFPGSVPFLKQSRRTKPDMENWLLLTFSSSMEFTTLYRLSG